MGHIVLVDIDGTISKLGDRLKYLNQSPIDWDSFYDHCLEDEPIPEMVELVDILMKAYHYQIVFCTGRRESVRDKTISWLKVHLFCTNLYSYSLLMRKDGDLRHDTEVKPELLKEAGINLDDIAFVLEDRDSMVKKWRELGLTCLQVAEGNF